MISANLSLVFNRRNKQLVTFKNHDVIVKKVDLSDKPAKKLLIVEAVELVATKSRLADALNISRQTVDNYIDSKKKFGTEGLLGGYNPNMGKNLAEYRRLTQQNRIHGNKAVILAEERKPNRLKIRKNNWSQILNSVQKQFRRTSNPSIPFMIGKSLVLRGYSLI